MAHYRLLSSAVTSLVLLMVPLAGAQGTSSGSPQLPVIASTFVQPAVIGPSPCWAFACFDGSVLDGDTLAEVGSAYSAIYISQRDASGTWIPKSAIPNPDPSVVVPGAPDPTFDFNYGHPIALDGNDLFVANKHEDQVNQTVTREVFVFHRQGGEWTLRQTITTSASAIALDRGTALIATGSSVLAFRRHPGGLYHLEATLEQEGASGFGSSVALHGRDALVGAPGEANGVGAAYVFRRQMSRWILIQKLTPASGQANMNFGASLAVDRDHIAIGSPKEARNSDSGAGTIQTFVRRGQKFEPEQLIDNPIPNPADKGIAYFGTTVALEGRWLLVGAHWRYSNSALAPTVNLFERHYDGWRAIASLAFRDTARSVQLSGARALVDAPGIHSGSDPLIFDLPAPTFDFGSHEPAQRDQDEEGEYDEPD